MTVSSSFRRVQFTWSSSRRVGGVGRNGNYHLLVDIPILQPASGDLGVVGCVETSIISTEPHAPASSCTPASLATRALEHRAACPRWSVAGGAGLAASPDVRLPWSRGPCDVLAPSDERRRVLGSSPCHPALHPRDRGSCADPVADRRDHVACAAQSGAGRSCGRV
jgi:hypothetical protein